MDIVDINGKNYLKIFLGTKCTCFESGILGRVICGQDGNFLLPDYLSPNGQYAYYALNGQPIYSVSDPEFPEGKTLIINEIIHDGFPRIRRKALSELPETFQKFAKQLEHLCYFCRSRATPFTPKPEPA